MGSGPAACCGCSLQSWSLNPLVTVCACEQMCFRVLKEDIRVNFLELTFCDLIRSLPNTPARQKMVLKNTQHIWSQSFRDVHTQASLRAQLVR